MLGWLFKERSREDLATLVAGLASVVILCIVCAPRGCAMHADAAAQVQALQNANASSAAAAPASGAGEQSSNEQSSEPQEPQEPAWEAHSWEELSRISSEIAAAATYEDGVRVAQSYRLLDERGAIDPAHTKRVDLPDGSYQVGVIGIRSDVKVDGSGVAGITFAFTSCVAQRPMNEGSTNQGGWYASRLRAWLNSDFFQQLPPDLSSVIVPVSKTVFCGNWPEDDIDASAGVGQSADGSTPLLITYDHLFLLSHHEIAGKAEFANAEDNASATMKMIDEEDGPYLLFAQAGVVQHVPNESLVRTYGGADAFWWLRTADPKNAVGFYDVSAVGTPTPGGEAIASFGVLPAFCI